MTISNFILARKRPLMFTLSSLLRVAVWFSRWSILKAFLHALEKTVHSAAVGGMLLDPGWVVHPAVSLRPSRPRRPSACFVNGMQRGDQRPLLRRKGPLLFPVLSLLPREPRLSRSVCRCSSSQLVCVSTIPRILFLVLVMCFVLKSILSVLLWPQGPQVTLVVKCLAC